MLQLHIFHRGSHLGHSQVEMFKICSRLAEEIQNFAAIPETFTRNLHYSSSFLHTVNFWASYTAIHRKTSLVLAEVYCLSCVGCTFIIWSAFTVAYDNLIRH